MSATPTQCRRVLRLLEQRADRGVTPVDFMAPTADGGKPILRLPARIADLRSRGHAIRSQLVTLDGGARVARYVLERSSSRPTTTPPDVAPTAEAVPLALNLGEQRRPPTPYEADVQEGR